jgi:N-acetylglucosaminyl-diphospho-decaprenol L-rhamnosyltransferase
VSDPGPVLSVILVSYNTRELTLRCLGDLFNDLHGIDSEVWLVDNASSDGTIATVTETYPEVRILASAENVGFGKANNQAMRLARGRYLMLLNTDAFLQPGAIASMLSQLSTHPAAGVVGPRLVNEDGSLQPSCFRFPSPARAVFENFWLSALWPRHPVVGDYRRWNHDEPRDVDWVVGACMMIRREVFERTHGFDEAFFMYAEEADWQRRIRLAGWTIQFTPAATVMHLGGASGLSDKPQINRHFFDSLDYYQRKNHGLSGLLILRAAMVFGCTLRAALWSILWLIPSRREKAAGKLKLHLWLIFRQATHWRLPSAL